MGRSCVEWQWKRYFDEQRRKGELITMALEGFISDLALTNTEEEVKQKYANLFSLALDTSNRHDLYTPKILFEFKYNKNLNNTQQRSMVLGQMLYYVRKMRYGETEEIIPYWLCMATKNQACITKTKDWISFYSETDGKYDWDVPASNPDGNLISDLQQHASLLDLHVYDMTSIEEVEIYYEKIKEFLDATNLIPTDADKKQITEDNFEKVFRHWASNFSEDVRNGRNPSQYFLADIQVGASFLQPTTGQVFFREPNGSWIEKRLKLNDYKFFWAVYDKVTKPSTMLGIGTKLNVLTEEDRREREGEFYTPLAFAEKGLEYIEKVVGKNWWNNGYKLWDMAAGTGNLEFHLPYEAQRSCYLSTLSQDDANYCKKLFPDAEVFQYDYLNDDVGNVFADKRLGLEFTWKLPRRLLEDLSNPAIKWIIFINPPFATSQKAGAKGKSKKKVSDTAIKDCMHDKNFGEASRELLTQFLFRISKEFEEKTAYLGLFSKLKYLNSSNDELFRNNCFHYEFKRGFVFSVENFARTNGEFPVGFLVWNLASSQQLADQEIILDVFNTAVEKYKSKKITIKPSNQLINEWFTRPRNSKNNKMPPLSNAITIKADNEDRRDRARPDFLASIMSKGSDFENVGYTAILSSPNASAGAFTVNDEIFEKSMVLHSVKRLPKHTWLNDRDNFFTPAGELPEEFVVDCVVWGLFNESNETSSLRNVEYEGNFYNIRNHFFPFSKRLIEEWGIPNPDISRTIARDTDRYVALWLEDKVLSGEAQAVVDKGKEIYRLFFENLHVLNLATFKIESWDAGWYQIRNTVSEHGLGGGLLEELKITHLALRQKLLPKLTEYGFVHSSSLEED